MTARRTTVLVAAVFVGVAVGLLSGWMGGTPPPSVGRSGSFALTVAPPPRVQAIAGAPRVRCPRAGNRVHTTAELHAALSAAAPGTVIRLADGVYRGGFVAHGSGTRRRPIWVCGGRRAIIDTLGSGRPPGSDGYGFHLDAASWWRLVGFSVRNADKGVVLDASSHDLLYRLTVYNIGDEGIHLRRFSSDDLVEACAIRDTGRSVPMFGEGVYIGTARSNWATDTRGRPDGSDRDSVRWCDIAQTTAESVDVKEGTSGGLVSDNRFDGAGMVATAARSWVNVKGSGYLVAYNFGQNSPADGFSTHRIATGGDGNVFAGNRVLGGVPGFGVFVDSPGTIVHCTAGGEGLKGLSNEPCRSAG